MPDDLVANLPRLRALGPLGSPEDLARAQKAGELVPPVGLTSLGKCRCCGRGPVYMLAAFDSHIGERLCNGCIESTLFNFIFRFRFPLKHARAIVCIQGRWQRFNFHSQAQEASIE